MCMQDLQKRSSCMDWFLRQCISPCVGGSYGHQISGSNRGRNAAKTHLSQALLTGADDAPAVDIVRGWKRGSSSASPSRRNDEYAGLLEACKDFWACCAQGREPFLHALCHAAAKSAHSTG
jgi:hypothetical protein